MSELVCLQLSAVLWLLHILTQGFAARTALGNDYLVSARDTAIAANGLFYGRATRALGNYLENYAPFIALDLGLITAGLTGGIGAMIWIVARFIYLPCYLLGLKYVRSLVWFASVIGLVLMGWRLAGF